MTPRSKPKVDRYYVVKAEKCKFFSIKFASISVGRIVKTRHLTIVGP